MTISSGVPPQSHSCVPKQTQAYLQVQTRVYQIPSGFLFETHLFFLLCRSKIRSGNSVWSQALFFKKRGFKVRGSKVPLGLLESLCTGIEQQRTGFPLIQ